MTQTMYQQPPKPGFGILPISTDLLASMFRLPDGYTIIGMNFNTFQRTLELTVMSEELPELQEGEIMPRLTLIGHRELWPDAPPEYCKITTEVKIL